jgi:TPP-dependent trihydroxycyclohexane-1,2-dione (THcHDO) dehydratase
MLLESKRPLIVAGGGVHYAQAWDELKAFSELSASQSAKPSVEKVLFAMPHRCNSVDSQ